MDLGSRPVESRSMELWRQSVSELPTNWLFGIWRELERPREAMVDLIWTVQPSLESSTAQQLHPLAPHSTRTRSFATRRGSRQELLSLRAAYRAICSISCPSEPSPPASLTAEPALIACQLSASPGRKREQQQRTVLCTARYLLLLFPLGSPPAHEQLSPPTNRPRVTSSSSSAPLLQPYTPTERANYSLELIDQTHHFLLREGRVLAL